MTSLATVFSFVVVLIAATINFAHACPPSKHVRRSDSNAFELINSAIDSLGGRDALSNLQGVTYQSDEYANYHLFETDRYVVSSGHQNVSFTFKDSEFSQRIDRSFTTGELFIFVRPLIAPRDFSMVAKSGSNGYVCFVEGSNIIYLPEEQTYGYVDGILTEYLLFQALKLSPRLLLEVEKHDPTATTVDYREAKLPAVVDDQLNITVVFDPETNLPLLIRAFEEHPILGHINNDLQLYNYTEVDGIQFPRTQKLIYGDDAILEETTVTEIYVNPGFEEGYFDGLSSDETETTPSPPRADPRYGHAEVLEYYSNTAWTGPYRGTLEHLNVSQPAVDLPGAHYLVFLNNSNFGQLVLEFEETVIVFEAPPHQSELVIQWVEENLKKPISHVWISHHHHDHSFDVAKFVGIGAQVIVAEMAASYWKRVPGIELVTFNEDKPYIHSDGKMQARFLFQPNTPHSSDWTYSIVTTACPSADTSMLAFNADDVSTNYVTDPNLADSWLLQARDDGMSRNTFVIPSHGPPIPFTQVIENLGSPYPDFNSTSFVAGGNICLDSAQ